MNGHLTRTVGVRGPGRRGTRWVVRCSCGWVGPARRSQVEAWLDAGDHVVAAAA